MIFLIRKWVAFFVLLTIKAASHLFYHGKYQWVAANQDSESYPSHRPGDLPGNLDDLRLLVFLNHTSLYEPLFLSGLPISVVFRLAFRMRLPGADVTLNRPLVGLFWKMMAPKISSISRKRDQTWDSFLAEVGEDDIVCIAPEGRMKRPSGLDKDGQPMTVRGGIAEILEVMHAGKMLICTSGGLHHVQVPGQRLPRLFQTIQMKIEVIEIAAYKLALARPTAKERKMAIIQDLQRRLEEGLS